MQFILHMVFIQHVVSYQCNAYTLFTLITYVTLYIGHHKHTSRFVTYFWYPFTDENCHKIAKLRHKNNFLPFFPNAIFVRDLVVSRLESMSRFCLLSMHNLHDPEGYINAIWRGSLHFPPFHHQHLPTDGLAWGIPQQSGP